MQVSHSEKLWRESIAEKTENDAPRPGNNENDTVDRLEIIRIKTTRKQKTEGEGQRKPQRTQEVIFLE